MTREVEGDHIIVFCPTMLGCDRPAKRAVLALAIGRITSSRSPVVAATRFRTFNGRRLAPPALRTVGSGGLVALIRPSNQR